MVGTQDPGRAPLGQPLLPRAAPLPRLSWVWQCPLQAIPGKCTCYPGSRRLWAPAGGSGTTTSDSMGKLSPREWLGPLRPQTGGGQARVGTWPFLSGPRSFSAGVRLASALEPSRLCLEQPREALWQMGSALFSPQLHYRMAPGRGLALQQPTRPSTPKFVGASAAPGVTGRGAVS